MSGVPDAETGSTLSLALERQSARAGGPLGRADRAKSTGRRTYCARNFAVSEFSPAAQPLETSGFCRSDAVTTQPPPGLLAPSSGRCANALEVEPAERHTERHKPNPARTVRSFSLSQRDNVTPDWCASAALSGGLESRHAAPGPTAETRFPVRS